MKYLKILILLFSMCFSAEAFAQVMPYRTVGGVDRTIDTQRRAPKTKSKKPKEKLDIIEVTIEQLDKKLHFDDFQKAAVRVIYNENKDEILGISSEDIPYEAKEEKAEKIAQKIDRQILELLSKEQTVIYQEMIDDRKD